MSLASPMEQWDAVVGLAFVFLLIGAGTFLWFAIGSIRAARKLTKLSARRKCQQCGYSLVGNVSGICPECGAPVSNPMAAQNPEVPN
jgi:hypothetical protein